MDGSGCCQISWLRAAPAPKPLSVDIVFGLRSFVINVVPSQNLLRYLFTTIFICRLAGESSAEESGAEGGSAGGGGEEPMQQEDTPPTPQTLPKKKGRKRKVSQSIICLISSTLVQYCRGSRSSQIEKAADYDSCI